MPRPIRFARPLLTTLSIAAAAAGAAALAPEPAPMAPVVSLAGLNADESIERDLCLTIAAGAGAAYECGDLRLVHGLPVTRTRDRARAPVLVYNSGHAVPTPIVSANVRLPAQGTVPDSVTVDLFLNGPSIRHSRWTGSAWTAGATRRVSLGISVGLASGAYPYTVEVANWYGAASYRATASDTLVIVNRAASPYRPGWWIAGVEELRVDQPAYRLWIGGDGSTRIYRPAGTNVWKAESLDRPDSLTWSPAAGRYTRHLPGGVRVAFDAAGRHVATFTRLGDSTTFHYVGATQRLQAIEMPAPAGAARPTYRFGYGSDALLDSVAAPPVASQARLTTLAWDGAQRTLTVRDPDTRTVVFGYAAADLRLQRRTDRLGTVTQYTIAGGRLGESRVLMTGSTTSAEDLVTSFLPAEVRTLNGAAALDTAAVSTRLNGPRAGSADTITFRLNRWGSPARIVDALGNVTQIHRQDGAYPALPTSSVAANGFTTRAEYDALGRLARTIALNARGDGVSDTTLYSYDDLWPDFVDQVRGPSGETTTMDYNPQGNLLWQEDSRGVRTSFRYYDTGPHAGRPSAEVQHLPGGRTAVDSIAYDGALGNVQTTVSPLGFRTLVTNDAVGRTISVEAPIDGALTSTTRTWYDVMGRDTLVRAEGPAMPYTPTIVLPNRLDPVGPEWTEVLKHYDAEGRLLSVSTHSEPDVVGAELHSYVYDRAGRKREEHQPTRTTYWLYDGAGNATETWTSGESTRTTMQYDLMNRLVLRVTPAEVESPGGCAAHGLTGNCGWTFPTITIPADSATFEYDAMGNLTVANNRDARVRRSYYPGGMLWTDSLRIRRYAQDGPVDCTTPGTICPDGVPGGIPSGGIEPAGIESGWNGPHPYATLDFNTHRYGISYEYDRSGRISRQVHPGNLSPTVGGSTRYRYGRAGELRAVTDARGDSVVFRYDTAGRPYRTDYPGGVYETRVWDDDGRLTSRVGRGTTGSGFWLYSDTLQYDARGKVLEVVQREYGGTTARNRYSGLGTLVLSEWGNPLQVPTIEEYRGDPLGHVYQSRTRGAQSGEPDPVISLSYYHPNSSALSLKTNVLLQDSSSANLHYQNDPDTTYSRLDNAGNSVVSGTASWTTTSGFTEPLTVSFAARSGTGSYYGADEKLRFVKRYSRRAGGLGGSDIHDGTFDEYWYDALGRRVLVRSLREDLCQASPTGCESTIERTVWAGDQVLYEIRAPGGSTDNLDAAPPLSHRQYGIVGYTHGGGIDQPLTVIRRNHPAGVTTIVPHANYRGVYRAGTTRAGTLLSCAPNGNCVYVNWPAPIRGAYHQGDATGGDWVGSLIPGMQDASGLLYRRNRYYNPATGQFTQTDPIGIAGGLNTYGFADGDPVSYGDPYGLAPFDDFYYNTRGHLIRTNKTYGPDRHFMLSNDESISIQLDGAPIAGDTPYRFINDPSQLDRVAKAIAQSEDDTYLNPIAFARESRNHGGDLDFKPDINALVGVRTLWNAGGGLYVHNDKVGNTAWGYYTNHHTIFTEDFAVEQATKAARQTNPSGVGEALDAQFIRRGFRIP